ncbi:MAG: MATE family efflux transporter [Desulfurococcales archaeon]|nr:MATE family efflux transporter [Desulfurococcales archaeon]
MGPASFLKGKYAREAVRIGWPLVIVESLDSIVSITDTFFVSRLGDDAIAGVGLASYIGWLLSVFGSLYYVGVMVLVAQAVGSRQINKASKIVGESLSASALMAIPIVLMGYLFASQLIGMIGGTGTVQYLGSSYMRLRVFGIEFWFILLVLDAAFRGSGVTKPLIYSSVTTATVNTVLDPLLIYGYLGFPRMGVQGAAVASVVSIALGALLDFFLTTVFLGFTAKPRIPSFYAIHAARVGFPAFVERVVFAGGNNLYMKSISTCGPTAIAAHTIGVRIESIAYMPAFAVSTAASSIIGQLVGSGKEKEARKAGFEIAGITALLMLGVGLLLVGISPFAPKAFTSSPDTRKLAMIYLILAGVSEPGLGVIMTIGGAIRGAGETRVPTVINLTSLYVARILPAYVFASNHIVLLGICPLGQWLSMDLDIAVRTIVFAFVYYRFIHRMTKKLV